MILLAQWLSTARGVPWPITAGFAVGNIIFVVFFLFRHRLTEHFLRRAGVRPETMSLEVRPEGLAVTTATRSSLTTWEGIDRIVVTKTHAFFYLNKVAALILPRRAFADEQEFEKFVETARGYYDAAKVSSESQQPG